MKTNTVCHRATLITRNPKTNTSCHITRFAFFIAHYVSNVSLFHSVEVSVCFLFTQLLCPVFVCGSVRLYSLNPPNEPQITPRRLNLPPSIVVILFMSFKLLSLLNNLSFANWTIENHHQPSFFIFRLTITEGQQASAVLNLPDMSSLCPAFSFSRTMSKNSAGQPLLKAHCLFVQNVRSNVPTMLSAILLVPWVKSWNEGLRRKLMRLLLCS